MDNPTYDRQNSLIQKDQQDNIQHVIPKRIVKEDGKVFAELEIPIGRSTSEAIFRLENLREIATEPGEWALDAKGRRVYYRPRKGERMDRVRVTAPFVEHSKMNDFTLNIEIDDQEYKVDLTDYLEELKKKSDIYAKSELTDEEEEILRNPALVLTEPNYKVIINSFGIEENREWETQIYNAEWYILIK